MIDDDFLKNVTNDKEKKFLKMTKQHVAKHLDKAEKIQKELK